MSSRASTVSTALAVAPGPSLSAWGMLPMPGTEIITEDLSHSTLDAVLSRGLGRSYGDSSLPARATDRVVATRHANRILGFDPETGILRVEAGFALAELNRLFMPLGFFSPVTPGTKFVTVGGMVASDVHGKNHHREGCFGAHVRWLKVRLADNSVVTCSPTELPDLFDGTIGGMGLLGHILEVEFTLHRIPSQWVYMESERVPDIDSFISGLNTAAPKWPMTMGWIDCLTRGRSMGRGVLMAGRWAEAHEAPATTPRLGPKITLPFMLPNWLLNPLTASLFNFAYYWRHFQKKKTTLVKPEPFFYPLDAILHWNRAYGARGFTQYQCVLPRRAGEKAVSAFMERLTALGGASPLCVIKDCGEEGRGVLSFPMEGTSIAVDMAVSPDIQHIVDNLNAFVIETGGRIYLTKDRFTRADQFRKMEPRLDRFMALRDKYDPQRRLRSAQSVRLFGDRA
ncbi:MAG: FAD-binding oxidoreductase [Myxococcales bacterium]|nr:FAD-binding oxidoreductase [Myxococcales bacterium]